MKITIKRPKWLPEWLNLPALLFFAFIVMLLFFGDYKFTEVSKQNTEINKLNAQIKSKEDSALYYEKKFRELDTDPENLEKLAREQYGMKRTNEDVYETDIK